MSTIPSNNLFSYIPDDLLREIVRDAFENSGNFNMRFTCKKWNVLFDPIIQQCWNNFKNVSIRAQMIEDKSAKSKQPLNYTERFRELHQCFKKELPLGPTPIAPIVVPDQYSAYENNSLMKFWEKAMCTLRELPQYFKKELPLGPTPIVVPDQYFAYENNSLMKLWEKAIWYQIRESVPKLNNPADVRAYLRSTDPQVREVLSKIKELFAINMGLDCIPEEVYFLPNLNYILAPENNLTALPAFLGHMKNLERLYIPLNKIEEFPDNFVEWTNLHTFCVDTPINPKGYAQLNTWAHKCNMKLFDGIYVKKA